MPTIAEVRSQYPQYNDMSDVELAGALHDRFYSDMPPDQFAEKIGLKPDKYQQAAIDEQSARDAAGDTSHGGVTRQAIGAALSNIAPLPLKVAGKVADTLTGGHAADLARMGQQGASFNLMDELYAGLETPAEMYLHGTINPAEGYNYAKAREDLDLQQARENTGYAGTAAELLGGAAGVRGWRGAASLPLASLVTVCSDVQQPLPWTAPPSAASLVSVKATALPSAAPMRAPALCSVERLAAPCLLPAPLLKALPRRSSATLSLASIPLVMAGDRLPELLRNRAGQLPTSAASLPMQQLKAKAATRLRMLLAIQASGCSRPLPARPAKAEPTL
ncbi:hypothetical protein AB8Z38_06760 [Bradyrhizobium sp. LLZ17]|uniref:Uncharacterized protein n=1 Tax=Bradyrhizobium sp. LLZ17 TaxID=3239388 RepID=A0AB39XPT8_9BRAD